MATSPLSEIWFHKESKTFYKIETNIEFIPGDYKIQRFDDVEKEVQKETLSNYVLEAPEVKVIIQDHYEKTKKAAAKAITAMTLFSVMTEKPAHEDFKNMFDGDPESVLGKSQEWVKNFMKTVQDENATKEDKKESFTSAFGQIPEILDFFNEEALKKAADNPDKWAEEMQEKVFGKENDERKAKEKKQRQSNINDQIRQNIEDAMKKNQNDS